MRVLGIETSCDETGVALYDTREGLLAQALHSQVAMHERYGGVVPELASRDHIRRLPRLVHQVCEQAGVAFGSIDGFAYTAGPGLAGALLVGAAFAAASAFALGRPAIGIHHLEGHLLSPLLAPDPPPFPFVALLCSGGHTQLLHVAGLGRYELLGDTLDDAAGEAFDKSAKLMGLGYPGGPAISRLAASGRPGIFRLPRPMLRAGNADFSFSGLKTAVLTQVRRAEPQGLSAAHKADLAREIEDAITEVLATKAADTVEASGTGRLVVAGGVSANRRLRERLAARAAAAGFTVNFPPLELCTDNGAMIAYAGALRLAAGEGGVPAGFDVRPRWPLDTLHPPARAA